MKLPSKWAQFRLPVIILVSFTVAALWVLVGRLLFGVFGWMFFILLFTLFPVIAIYGVVLSVIVLLRQRTHVFGKSGPFVISVVITLAALFVFGIFVPDAGDTKDSGSSALSTMLLDRSNSDLIALSGAICGWALFVAFVASVAALIFVFIEKPRNVITHTSASPLKESK